MAKKAKAQRGIRYTDEQKEHILIAITESMKHSDKTWKDHYTAAVHAGYKGKESVIQKTYRAWSNKKPKGVKSKAKGSTKKTDLTIVVDKDEKFVRITSGGVEIKDITVLQEILTKLR